MFSRGLNYVVYFMSSVKQMFYQVLSFNLLNSLWQNFIPILQIRKRSLREVQSTLLTITVITLAELEYGSAGDCDYKKTYPSPFLTAHTLSSFNKKR